MNIHKYHLCTAVILPAAALLLCSCGERGSSKSGFLLDTAVSVKVYSKNSDETAAAAMDRLRASDVCFSKVCGSGGTLTDEDADRINGIIRFTEDVNDRYGGKVDLFCGELTSLWGISGDSPRVPRDDEISAVLEDMKSLPEDIQLSAGESPGYVDLGAAAKGAACDDVYENVPAGDGWCIVSAGSSAVMYGSKEGGFTIAVRSPDDPDGGYLGRIKTDGCFLSTSGGYERFFEADGKRYTHIFDCETGFPADTDLTSVTVICPLAGNGGLRSDIMSTMIYAGGSAELGKYAAAEDIGIIAADEDKNIYIYGSGFEFEPDESIGDQYTIWKEN